MGGQAFVRTRTIPEEPQKIAQMIRRLTLEIGRESIHFKRDPRNCRDVRSRVALGLKIDQRAEALRALRDLDPRMPEDLEEEVLN